MRRPSRRARRSRSLVGERGPRFLATDRAAADGRGVARRARLIALAVLVAIALAPRDVRADLEEIPYVVVAGDNASRIAARHGLTLRALRDLNGASDLERLRVGQRLVVGEGRLVLHRVRPGETAAVLAERYGVRPREIAAWNDGISIQRIAVDRELRIFARRDEPRSGSIGEVGAGSLENGIAIPPHPAYRVRDSARAWVTRDVAERITRAFDAVRARWDDLPALEIRDASRPSGGPMREHHSHQSGRDVDLAYYRVRCPRGICGHSWIRPDQLDAERQWALLETWIRAGHVEYVFVDHALQRPLYEAARAAGATREELATWFQWPRGSGVRAGIVRHVPRHTEHLHVRFTCAPHDERCVPSCGGTNADDAS
jgi:murein endopeptidase